MKKEYVRPSMKMVRIQTSNIICTSPIYMNNEPLEGEYD